MNSSSDRRQCEFVCVFVRAKSRLFLFPNKFRAAQSTTRRDEFVENGKRVESFHVTQLVGDDFHLVEEVLEGEKEKRKEEQTHQHNQKKGKKAAFDGVAVANVEENLIDKINVTGRRKDLRVVNGLGVGDEDDQAQPDASEQNGQEKGEESRENEQRRTTGIEQQINQMAQISQTETHQQ